MKMINKIRERETQTKREEKIRKNVKKKENFNNNKMDLKEEEEGKNHLLTITLKKRT